MVRMPPKPVIDAQLEHLRKVAATLRSNLEKCAADPGVDPVHDVRTGTRRVQAMVEAILRERGEAASSETGLEEAAGKWLRQLKRIRRAAAPVRDLDVHRKLLQRLVDSGRKREIAAQAVASGAGEAAVTVASPNIVDTPAAVLPTSPVEQQAEHLDAWLAHVRQHQSAELKKQAAKALPKFDAEAAAFETAISQSRHTRSRARSAAIVALESFVQLVHEMQQLDAGNLHDFRKGAKKARYIAESAAEDAHALVVGKALKKLQDEIGDWHDWLVLADEAPAALGEEGKDLIALLNRQRDHHYALSMKTVDRLRGKLMGEWLATTQPQRRVSTVNGRRLPVKKELPS